MSITTETTRLAFVGDGNDNSPYAISFPLRDDDSVEMLYVTDSTGAEVLKTIGSGNDYTIVIADDFQSADLTLVSTAPASGETLVIRRNEPGTRLSSYSNFDGQPSGTMNSDYDKATMQVQTLQEQVDRAILVFKGHPKADLPLTPLNLIGNAGKAIVVNAGETDFELILDSIGVGTIDPDKFLDGSADNQVIQFNSGLGEWEYRSDLTIDGLGIFGKNQNSDTLFLARNTTSGTAASVRIEARSNAAGIRMTSFSSAFTTSGRNVADSGLLESDNTSSAGLGISAMAGGIAFWTANVSRLTLDNSGNMVFNESGASVDFRFEGDLDATLMVIDGSTDRVGVGLSTPGTKFHVRRDQNGSTTIKVENDTSGTAAEVSISLKSNAAIGRISSFSSAFTTSNEEVADSFLIQSDSTSSAGLGLAAVVGGIAWWTANVSRLTIDNSGNMVFNESGAPVDARFEGDTKLNLLVVDGSADRVGIGVSTPSALLEVAGAMTVSSGDITITSGDISAPSGRINVGEAADGWTMHKFAGSMTHDASDVAFTGFDSGPTLTTAAGATPSTDWVAMMSSGSYTGGSITTHGGTLVFSVVTTLYLSEPNITKGSGDTITDASTLHIDSAPDEGVANHAIYIKSGAVTLASGSLVLESGSITASGAIASATLGTTGLATLDSCTVTNALIASGGLNVTGDTTLGGTETHVGVGIAPSNFIQTNFGGTMTSGGGSSFASGLSVRTDVIGGAGDISWLALFTIGAQAGASIATQTTEETINLVATLHISEPNITDNLGGSEVITNAATVYIRDAPTEGTNNYALWVDAGSIRFDSLAGSGSRTVVADANGVLSAPP